MPLTGFEIVELDPTGVSFARSCGNSGELVRIEIDVAGPLIDRGLLEHDICQWLRTNAELLHCVASAKYDRGEFRVFDGLDVGYSPEGRRYYAYDRGHWHEVRLSEDDLRVTGEPVARRMG